MNEKIAVFAGAGISKDEPSNLPSWWDYNKYVLDAIQQEASKVFIEEEPFYSSEEMLEKLPVTSISDVLFTCGMGKVYFNMVSCLEGTCPNMNHFILANMAKEGHLSCVITTNFDTLIEQAFDELKVPYKAIIEDEEYSVNIKEDICLIVKLHGSVNSTDSLIDTVTQKMKGLTEAKKKLLREILCEYSTYVIGMSGEDLRFDLDYFQFLSSNANNKIIWIKHPKGKISSKVSQLKDQIGMLIVEDEIQNVFHDFIPIISDSYFLSCENKEQIDISEKIGECVSSLLVGPYVCMGIVLLLLSHIGNTVKTTKICVDILDLINKDPARFFKPMESLIVALLHDMGLVLINSGNIELAIEAIQRSILIQNNSLSQLHEFYFSNKCLEYENNFSIEEYVVEYLSNVGNEYVNLGCCLLKRREGDDLEIAKDCYQKALDYFTEAKDTRGINLAKSSLFEVDFNQNSFDIFHNSEEEYNEQVLKYSSAIGIAHENGDFETFVTQSCLLSKLFMEYGEYLIAENTIESLENYIEIDISVSSKARFKEIRAEWYIRHNMEDECQQEIEEAISLIEKSGNDIYLKRNLCLCGVRLLGHSYKCLNFLKKCLVYLQDNQDIHTIDRYYDTFPIDEAISLVNDNKPIFPAPFFFEMGQNYLKEKSKVIRAAIIRATFYNDKEMLVLLFENLVSECAKILNLNDLCRMSLGYVEASKRLVGGSYRYESTYYLICCLNQLGYDKDGSSSLHFIDDVLQSDDSDDSEYNDIVGNLYACKANILLLRGNDSESEKCFVSARDKLCDNEALWRTQVKIRVNMLIQLEMRDKVLKLLLLSYPDKSEDEIEVLYKDMINDQ